jgi:hypothetical protein
MTKQVDSDFYHHRAETKETLTEPKVLLDKWHERLRLCSRAHFVASDRYTRLHYVFGLLAAVLSAAIGCLVLASPGKVNLSVLAAPVVGLISFLAAGLTSVQTFLRFIERSEQHRIAATKYSALKREAEELITFFPEGENNQRECVKAIRERWDEITNEAPSIADKTFIRIFRPRWTVDDSSAGGGQQ